MARDIDWKMKRDEDGSTYDVRVVRFSGKFKFQFQEKGAARWEYNREPSRADLEYFLDLIQRRYRRREATWKEVQMAEALLKALGRREAEEAAAILRREAGETDPQPVATPHGDLSETAEEILDAGEDDDTLAVDFQDVSAAFAAPTAIETIKAKLQKAVEEEEAPASPKLSKLKKAATELKPSLTHSSPPASIVPTEPEPDLAKPKDIKKKPTQKPKPKQGFVRLLAEPLKGTAFVPIVAKPNKPKPAPKPKPVAAQDLSPARAQALAQAKAIAKSQPKPKPADGAKSKSSTSAPAASPKKPRKRAP
ncbi:MAG TPA: hypothetical protein VK970_11020 [Candidatus Methylacidiphilales bacterium]|nr:hypothetical protein [Candidatus Methylacidiphilales bacterium]